MTVPLESPPITAAPDTLDGLRALALEIGRGAAPITLGSKAAAALSRLIEMVGSPALLSITTLAGELGVNPSTLTRLARSLGYSGFPALQQVLLSASMAAPGAFYSRQAQAALQGRAPARARAEQLCHENQANIARFIENFDETAFSLATRLILNAPRVTVHGIRQFHSVASFLVYGLRMIRSDVQLLDANNLGTAEGLALLGAGDVLISVSCAPYSSQVVDVAAIAADIGLDVIALTDRAASPLVGPSRAAILVEHKSSFLSNSMGAFMVAIECLINSCATARPEAARKALKDRDDMIERLGIERTG
ncbi:MurR/RpiR family transcriptional regulator [Paracoccus methylovorus]|uniref:DNA-binding transcriptional regulator, MurR/RpiR family, contains HTH and SIS domains n=2 Tax=Paracoccus TaxID=265 RepID=A0A1H8KH33_9RHOB|nr:MULTISPECIES: MurR/RpiR family transcriptional regulator [Paracoccus]QRZ12842.1 MurR/RpiR family transcriptional regulator [Paracoccus methylovorus]WCR18937.1 MurR/RpiR family transcriptional regulator [Paracoccus alcaliphilus]SEN92280.1 DNA-binding transcriptional regulator, MurR/RpiR family, contains HTH and SIS domains [Paracoccus alcaliphilus]